MSRFLGNNLTKTIPKFSYNFRLKTLAPWFPHFFLMNPFRLCGLVILKGMRRLFAFFAKLFLALFSVLVCVLSSSSLSEFSMLSHFYLATFPISQLLILPRIFHNSQSRKTVKVLVFSPHILFRVLYILSLSTFSLTIFNHFLSPNSPFH